MVIIIPMLTLLILYFIYVPMWRDRNIKRRKARESFNKLPRAKKVI